VLKSWAVPKGMLERLGLKRLAVQVEDHEVAFGQLEGAIPRGEYGAGHIKVWDCGESVSKRQRTFVDDNRIAGE
jgi:bifunctional non-homologous end joining protein LigD